MSNDGVSTNGPLQNPHIYTETMINRNTPVVHFNFPVSKSAVRKFRGKMEDTIEQVNRSASPLHSKTLGELLQGPLKQSNTNFPMQRNMEQPIIYNNGMVINHPVNTSSLSLHDLMRSPVNFEATPPADSFPIQETPRSTKTGWSRMSTATSTWTTGSLMLFLLAPPR